MSATPTPRATGGDPAPGDPASASVPPKVRHRPSWIVFVVLGAIVCLGMGVWQLARFQAVTGTVQNLGYTFMWPFLAGFLVYAYYKYIRLEADEAAEEGPAPDPATVGGSDVGSGDAVGGTGSGVGVQGQVDDDEVGTRPQRVRAPGRARRRSAVATEIPEDILPIRRTAAAEQPEDEGLRAYNTYLAELARQDGAIGDHSQENSYR